MTTKDEISISLRNDEWVLVVAAITTLRESIASAATRRKLLAVEEKLDERVQVAIAEHFDGGSIHEMRQRQRERFTP